MPEYLLGLILLYLAFILGITSILLNYLIYTWIANVREIRTIEWIILSLTLPFSVVGMLAGIIHRHRKDT